MGKIANSETLSDFLRLIGYEKFIGKRSVGGGFLRHLFSKTSPSVTFENITYRHNTYYNDLYWLRINITLFILNMAEKKAKLFIWFYYANGQKLKANDKNYTTVEGQVVSGIEFTPSTWRERYENLHVFIPYASLNLVKGTHELRFDIGVYDEYNNLVGRSDYYYFDITFN